MKRVLSIALVLLLVFSLSSVAFATDAPVLSVSGIKNDEYATVTVTLPANSKVTNGLWLLEYDSTVLEFDAEGTKALSENVVCGISKKLTDTCVIAVMTNERLVNETQLAVFGFKVIDPEAESASFTLKSAEVRVSDSALGTSSYEVTSTAVDYPFTIQNCTHESITWDATKTIASTCLEHGTEFGTCDVCGKEFSRELPLGDHAYVWTTTTPPDFDNDGSEHGVCSVCGDETDRIVPHLIRGIVFKPEAGVIYDEESDIVRCILPKTDANSFITDNIEYAELVKNRTRDAEAAQCGYIGTGSEFFMVVDGVEVDLVKVAVFADVDGNGTISTTDARLALRAAASLDVLTDVQLAAANTTADGSDAITTSDARAILRMAASLDAPADVMAAVYSAS